ncbi:CLIP domain-containing serine protease HP8-like [Drosophila takahashii]|uniref:CLIP domain-containing serine protease HP8-like n=1 Tax=Drosophila takahashii TaxID=29030 RepID=UPI003898E5EF
MNIAHPKFDPQKKLNDVGLLRLDREVQYNDIIRPICMVLDSGFNPKLMDKFQVFGWGITENITFSEELKMISLARRDPIHCFNAETYSKICAGALIGDTCSGDSGGPLVGEVQYMDNLIIAQIGIADGVYTDIKTFTWWIRYQISNYKSP